MKLTDVEHSEAALSDYEERWKKRLLVVTAVYLLIAFVEILPAYEAPRWLMVIDAALMSVFVADYLWRVCVIRPPIKHYWRRGANIIDLIVIVTYPLVPLGVGVVGFARGLRLLSTVVRVLRAVAVTGKFLEGARRVFTKRSVAWMGPLIILLAFLVAVYIWREETLHRAEAGKGESLGAPGRALWWGIDILMTGDSDISPVSTEGHILSVVIALLGIALFGLVTAWLAAAFVENDEEKQSQEVRETLLRVKVLGEQVEELRRIILSLPGLGERTDERAREWVGELARLDGSGDVVNEVRAMLAERELRDDKKGGPGQVEQA